MNLGRAHTCRVALLLDIYASQSEAHVQVEIDRARGVQGEEDELREVRDCWQSHDGDLLVVPDQSRRMFCFKCAWIAAAVEFRRHSVGGYKVSCVAEFLAVPAIRQKFHFAFRFCSGITSLTFTAEGEAFYLHSSSEFQRITLSATKVTALNCKVDLPESCQWAWQNTEGEFGWFRVERDFCSNCLPDCRFEIASLTFPWASGSSEKCI